MGNENSRDEKTILFNELKNPSARIERLINQERSSIEAKVTNNILQGEISFLLKLNSLCNKKNNLDETKELLNAIDYFKNKGRISDASSKHAKEIQQVQRQLKKSKENVKLLAYPCCSKIDQQIEPKKIEKTQQQKKKEQEDIQSIKNQLQTCQQDYHFEKLQLHKKFIFLQEERQKQKEQFQQEYQQYQNNAKNFLEQLKNGYEEEINKNNSQKNVLQSQVQDKQNQLKVLKSELVIKQKKYKIYMKKIQQNLERQRLIQMLKDTELSKDNTEEDIKIQLQKLNPYQQVSRGQIEFVKQFMAVQEDKPTQEQVKVIEKKHQEVISDLLFQLQENQEKPNIQLGYKEQNKIDGYRGVLLLHQMLANQGITSFLTDKPMHLLEQSSSRVYQLKIIQCGIQDSSSYFIANYDSPQYMEKQILNAQSLDNYIQNFKDDMVKKFAEKDFTSQNIQVFTATTQPPRVNFQIDFKKKIDIQRKDFKSLGINVESQNLLDKAELSIDMFDPNYNMSWDHMTFSNDYRGALQFHNRIGPTPQIYNFPIGYYGLGLRVVNRYGQDQRWIRADTSPETWIVLYHGTRYSNLKGIIYQNNINPGKRNQYGGYKCRITGNIIQGGQHSNTYLTDNVLEAEPYSIPLNKKDNIPYSLVFQCRVDPKKVMSPESRPEYYTVENPLNEIRPYRLLIKQIKY